MPLARPRHAPLRRTLRGSLRLPALVAAVALGGCVFRVDVQQGNLLDQADIEAVQPGMTRSQVRFLLGTPVVQDPFHQGRWDYMYYLRPGRSRQPIQRWLIVEFDGDVVKAIRRDVPVGKGAVAAAPASTGPANDSPADPTSDPG